MWCGGGSSVVWWGEASSVGLYRAVALDQCCDQCVGRK